ncbi:acetate/propionate family kinase [Methylophaga sp.]|uniref:acetate/propionate family kinase n=1 Tax=Methylophaga sp. TaxID=2024840 RepID=UPI003F69E403
MKQILVINSGSSSIKFKIFDLTAAATLITGYVTGIGDAKSEYQLNLTIDEDSEKNTITESFRDHIEAFNRIFDDLASLPKKHPEIEIDAIGHRVVHGGTRFTHPVRLTPDMIDEIGENAYLAPQHMPGNLIGMRRCMATFADTPQVAVFDTSFHQSMPEYAFRYPVPEKWFSDYGIRRFGFHGTSHQYVSGKAAEMLNKPAETLNIISLHLGNGDSACAIHHGHSIDTSMGFTPLEGLMMGSRSGDLDASIPLYLQQRHGLSADEVTHQLNFDSGLQAICHSHDMHEIIERAEQGDRSAQLALDMFVHHIRKYIGAYLITLKDVDALIFSGGIGENAATIRARCCEGLENFGIVLDQNLNLRTRQIPTVISAPSSKITIFMIPTQEELQIAYEVSHLLNPDR